MNQSIRTTLFIVLFSTLTVFSSVGQHNALITNFTDSTDINIVVDSALHEDYGLAYPATYIVEYIADTFEMVARYKYSNIDEWDTLVVKTREDFFNGETLVRFDTAESLAYISVPFSANSDSIIISLTDSTGQQRIANFNGIAPYYDNRKAVVTSTADDWGSWFHQQFSLTVSKFQSYKIPISVAIIADDESAWHSIQNYINQGYVEAVAHSRTHPRVEYSDLKGEVKGCKDDIIRNLDLPAQFKKGDKEYVYVWVAPYGEYSQLTEDMVISSKYLASRMYTYYDDSIPKWNTDKQMFNLTGATIEIGDVPWESPDISGDETYTDLFTLNGRFDYTYETGGIYHLMCHPHVIFNDWLTKTYLDQHLEYISEHKDIWYSNYGHIFVYQLLAQNVLYDPTYDPANLYVEGIESVETNEIVEAKCSPNPFYSSTAISFALAIEQQVKINIYNSMGEKVKVIAQQRLLPGEHKIEWAPQNLPGGMYYIELITNNGRVVKSVVYL